MRRVYLDQWAWVELAKAAKGTSRDENFLALLEFARFGTKRGMLSFPLSTIHYMELYQTSNARQRHELGTLMHELSLSHRMISPTNAVVAAEFDTALNKRFGRPSEPRKVQVFGLGVGHAFNLGDVRGRLVPREGVSPGSIDPVWKAQFEAEANDHMEWALLCGPGEGEEVPGYDPNAHRVFADKFVLAEEDQAEKFQRFKADSAYQQRVLTAREWILLMNEVAEEALTHAGIDFEWFLSQGAEFLTDFLSDLPVVHTQVEMKRLQHQNRSRRWTSNDHYDVTALSMAVVHCDAVVTEKHWAHLLRRGRLDQKYCTTIVDKRTLPELLDALLRSQT